MQPIPDPQQLRPLLPPTHFKALSVDFLFWFCFAFQSFDLVPVSLPPPFLGRALGLRGCVRCIAVELTASMLAQAHGVGGGPQTPSLKGGGGGRRTGAKEQGALVAQCWVC